MATVSGMGKGELEAELKEAVKGMLVITHLCAANNNQQAHPLPVSGGDEMVKKSLLRRLSLS